MDFDCAKSIDWFHGSQVESIASIFPAQVESDCPKEKSRQGCRDAHVSDGDGLVRHSFSNCATCRRPIADARTILLWVWAFLTCIWCVHISIVSTVYAFYLRVPVRYNGINILDVWCKPRADPVAVCRCPGRVIVVGAGLAGLVAAQSLRRAACLPANSESACFKQQGFGLKSLLLEILWGLEIMYQSHRRCVSTRSSWARGWSSSSHSSWPF